MLKKSHSLYSIALLSLILSSCGDKKPSDSVEPLAVSIAYPIENSKIARDVPFRASIESLEGIESAKFFIDDSLIVSVKSFINNNTTINPLNLKKSTYLVTDGLFRFSRNPMYLGMLLFLLGTSIVLNIIGGLIISILFIFYMNFFQIMPEEKALENLFGKDYRNYLKSVRRWI